LDGFTIEDSKILQINIYDDLHEEEGRLHKDTKNVTTMTKQNPKNIVPKEYHYYLPVFKEREKLMQPPLSYPTFKTHFKNRDSY
jgi:hypothetical protein